MSSSSSSNVTERESAHLAHLRAAALAAPCRSPAGWSDPSHCRLFRAGHALVRVALTIDRGRPGPDGGDFVPGGYGEAAWHGRASVVGGGNAAVPLSALGEPEFRAALRLLLDALAPVGAGEPGFPGRLVGEPVWRSPDAIHAWKRLSAAELAGLDPGPTTS